ncbi:MAG: carbon-nitrogen hydrolase family protein [Janthinobacterium lividum]
MSGARPARAAVLQMTAGIDPLANAATLIDAIERAAVAGAPMLLTPEMSGLLDRDRSRAGACIVAEDEDRVLSAIRDAAARHGIWIHLGSLAIRRPDGRYANRGFVIDDTGAIRARYDKLHLFDVDLPTGERWRESATYAPGEAAIVVDTPLGRLGLSICYDLRFADLYRALAEAGAELLSIPAAFTRPTGAAHWHVLMRARAIETGAFVLAAAQTGEHADGRATYGHSLGVDPWGRVLLDMGETPGLGIVEIDRALVADARTRIPVAAHRRPIPPVDRA